MSLRVLRVKNTESTHTTMDALDWGSTGVTGTRTADSIQPAGGPASSAQELTFAWKGTNLKSGGSV